MGEDGIAPSCDVTRWRMFVLRVLLASHQFADPVETGNCRPLAAVADPLPLLSPMSSYQSGGSGLRIHPTTS